MTTVTKITARLPGTVGDGENAMERWDSSACDVGFGRLCGLTIGALVLILSAVAGLVALH